MGGPWSLSRIVGSARARELYFMPDKFDAAEALRIGLVTRVFPDDRFQEEVDAIVNRLTDSAPIALRTLKANFVDSERMDFAGYVALETERHFRMFETEDTREAFAAKAAKAQTPIQRPLISSSIHLKAIPEHDGFSSSKSD